MTLSGAVIVTTPHPLSVVDVAKGMQMFRDVRVPTLAIVENMAPFTDCHGVTYAPFGLGGKERMLEYFEMKDSPLQVKDGEKESILRDVIDCPFFSFPLVISPSTSDVKSSSTSFQELLKKTLRPVVLSSPNSEHTRLFYSLGSQIIREIFKLQMNAYLTPSLSYVENRGIVLRYFTASSAEEYVIDPVDLRCRDPKTGKITCASARIFYTGIHRSCSAQRG